MKPVILACICAYRAQSVFDPDRREVVSAVWKNRPWHCNCKTWCRGNSAARHQPKLPLPSTKRVIAGTQMQSSCEIEAIVALMVNS